MHLQAKLYIIVSIAFLLPVGVYIFQWVFFMLGKAIYSFVFPKFKRNSKLRYKIIEFSHNCGGYDLLYILIGTVVAFLFLILVSLFM